MHIAFGRVRHKTSPTRGGENVCLFFWFTIVPFFTPLDKSMQFE